MHADAFYRNPDDREGGLTGPLIAAVALHVAVALLFWLGLCLAAGGLLSWLIHLYLQPVRVTLNNGHWVMRPRSRLLLVMVFLLPAIWLSLLATRFNLGIITQRGHHMMGILGRIFTPNFEYFGKVWPPLLDTLKMSLVGSALGSFLSLPVAVMASSNINRSKVSLWLLRVVVNVVRTLPTLIIASVSALIFGLGTFAGTVAITVFTFGVVSKMLYESIETIDMGPFEAMESLGASRFQAFWSACMPGAWDQRPDGAHADPPQGRLRGCKG